MQSTFQLIFSGCIGVMLVLASCVLVAPLWAIFVAVACVGSAWVLLHLDCGRVVPRTAETDGLADGRVPAVEEWDR